MQFPQTRAWETIGPKAQRQREKQRISLLKTDANPNPDYRLPHQILLNRGGGKK